MMRCNMACGQRQSTGGSHSGAMPLRRTLLVIAVLGLVPGVAAAAEQKKQNDSFVQIDTLTAAVMSPNGRRAVMTVQAGVDAPDPGLHTLAAQVMPRLRDAYTQVLGIYAAQLAPGSPPDADYMAQQLQRATDRVLGRPGGRLLLGGVMIN